MIINSLDLSNETRRFTGARRTAIGQSEDMELDEDRVITEASEPAQGVGEENSSPL